MREDSRREAPTANLTIRKLDPALKERLRVRAARHGHPLAVEDGMIAAIARTHAATVVTRDVGGFERCGVTIVNPWEH